MTNALAIDRIEAWACEVPVEHPFRLGRMVIDRREFAVLRIRAGELTGQACALSRGAPVDVVVTDLLAPLLLGLDPRDVSLARERMRAPAAPLGTGGLLARAASLVDVALWDLKAQAAGLPLWAMLGGFRREAPMMGVLGYPADGESPEAFAGRIAADADRLGWPLVKLGRVGDAEAMADRLRRCREVLPAGTGVVVDAHWAMGGVRQTLEAAAAWAPHGVEFIEDPLPLDEVRAYAELRSRSAVPVAAGDEAPSLDSVLRLLRADAIDVLRLDALTTGGISAALDALAHARAAGARVSVHIAPEVHRHLAFAFPEVEHVEAFPPGSPFFPVDRLVDPASLQVRDGRAVAPDAPGIGWRIDWEAVEGFSRRAAGADRA